MKMRTEKEIMKRIFEYQSIGRDYLKLNLIHKARIALDKAELLDWVLGE